MCALRTGDAKLTDALRAARLYFLQDMTMEEIACDMATSRSSVSRMIALAKAEGLIEFRLRDPEGAKPALESLLQARFRVDAHVVPIPEPCSDLNILEHVAQSAAWRLGTIFESGMVLGVAWGTTTGAVSRHVSRRATHGSDIVQLNGASNTVSTGIDYASDILSRFGRAFGARVQQFPVPTFFDYAETKRCLWRERSIVRILELQARADVVIFSVGGFCGGVPSHVYSGGFLEREDYAVLQRCGAVGDVATHFLREDGTYDAIPLNERSSGPSPDVLRRAARRICVVAGQHKVVGLRGALAAGLVTDLVLDEQTAASLLA